MLGNGESLLQSTQWHTENEQAVQLETIDRLLKHVLHRCPDFDNSLSVPFANCQFSRADDE